MVLESRLTPESPAERALREGDLDGALARLQEQVRKDPSAIGPRVFLFQLLAVMGQWERALTQLATAAELDPAAMPMMQTYTEAIRCELLRADVFAGRRAPLVFGEPDTWLALLIEALLVSGGGRAGDAEALRARAFEEAPASAGTIDGTPFTWIADADMRLGPVCEAIVNGRYYWVPFARIARLDIEAPVDLRDVVWAPAHFLFENGGETVGLIPTRYPGSEAAADPALRLGRRTEWTPVAEDVFTGLGQRVFTTDEGEHSLLETRAIVIGDDGGADTADAPGA